MSKSRCAVRTHVNRARPCRARAARAIAACRSPSASLFGQSRSSISCDSVPRAYRGKDFPHAGAEISRSPFERGVPRNAPDDGASAVGSVAHRETARSGRLAVHARSQATVGSVLAIRAPLLPRGHSGPFRPSLFREPRISGPLLHPAPRPSPSSGRFSQGAFVVPSEDYSHAPPCSAASWMKGDRTRRTAEQKKDHENYRSNQH